MNGSIFSLAIGLILAALHNAICADPESASTNSVATAIERGQRWLAAQQQENGAWTPDKYPAVTAMALAAFRPSSSSEPVRRTIQRGNEWLLSNVRPDGGVYSGTNYQNYNTSWALIALSRPDLKTDATVIRKARERIVSWQMDLNEQGKRDNALDGGFGYGDGTPRANMANTLAPLTALHETRSLASPDEPRLNREGLLEFLHHSQNFATVNSDPGVCRDEDNLGGFIYYPGRSFAGEVKLPDGQTGHRSYGSMTCAGLLCYLYAGVDRKAPEVQTTFDWIQRHFTAEMNPGMDQQGLFYYYQVMARALSVYGADTIKTPDGQLVDWRAVLGKKLIALQKPDGSWVNPEKRWMEDNPVLCTAYALLALNDVQRR